MIPSPPALLLTPDQRSAFLERVDRHYGIRGSEYGLSRLDDAVSRILPDTSCTTADELLAELEGDAHPRWMPGLVEHLTVGETYFLRDPAQIAALRTTILPDAVRRRASEKRLRIWSAGCSTGEEPYTLAILLREQNLAPAWDVLLVGTDVNRESLRLAREGYYAAWSFRATPDDVRDRYFEPVGARWRVSESIRRMTRFGWTNFGAEAFMPPSSDLDLILCRNVTIYFDDAATQRLYRALVAALALGGWLMLGPSDPPPSDREGLERVELKDALAWRRVKDVKPTAAKAVRSAAVAQTLKARTAPRTAVAIGDSRADIESGLLALEAGALADAVEWLRRAVFRDPHNPLAQFALARAYVQTGHSGRAQTALVQARRLLAPLDGDSHVPGSDALAVKTLREAIRAHIKGLEE